MVPDKLSDEMNILFISTLIAGEHEKIIDKIANQPVLTVTNDQANHRGCCILSGKKS